MKALPLVMVFGLICAAPVALAQSEAQDHSAHHPAPGAEPGATTTPGHDHGAGNVNAVQQNMRKIEALMQQIQQTTDPAHKRELLAQHLQAMRDQMRLIRSQHSDMKLTMKEGSKPEGGMMGGMMQDGGMMGGGMMMHKQMEQRLEILERMLQQTLEREAAEASAEQH